MNTVCILMAAGAAKRFGSNKLIALYRSDPLYVRAMDAIPTQQLHAVVVVSGCEDVLALAKERGFFAVENFLPEEGVARTIRMGLDKANELHADAAMFMVCDQPLLTRESVAELLTDFEAHPDAIVCMAHGERRGNPAVFPKRFFNELYALQSDNGGSDVIRAHEDALVLHQVKDPRTLIDVDGAHDLRDIDNQGRMGDNHKDAAPAEHPSNGD